LIRSRAGTTKNKNAINSADTEQATIISTMTKDP
jgi:hypothetical protein